MASKQTYLVETVFQVADKTSKPADEMAKSLQRVADNAQGLQSVLKGLGAAFVGSRLFSEAKKLFIDYNSQIEQSKVQIGGMLAMYTGNPIEKTFERAGVAVENFQEMAKRSSLTTKDLVDTASGLTRPLLQAGLSMKDIEKLSFGVANASKAFGISGAVTAMDIEQALTVGVHQRDRFSRNILAQKDVGLSMEKFNALDMPKRVEALKKALTTSAITDMAKKQGEDTFGGVMSTLEDNFQILGSKVGLPLFKAITNEVKDWNKWIDNNSRQIGEIGKTVGTTLVSGFKVLKDVFSWMYDHSATLITVAKAYAAIKLGGMLSGGLANSLGGIGGGASGLLSFFRRPKGPSDSIDPFTGEYRYTPGTPGGRGHQAVGGFRGVAENAQALGQIFALSFAAGHLLNEFTGLSDSIAGVRTVNGQVLDITDRTTQKYATLVTSMGTFDKAIQEAADRLKGLGGGHDTQAAANLAGMSDVKARQANLLGDMLRDGSFGDNDFGKMIALARLRKSGLFDEDEISKAMSNPEAMKNRAAQMSEGYKFREQEASKSSETAWQSIPEELRKNLDQTRVMQALMQKTLQLMPMNGGAFSQGIVLAKEDIEKVLKEVQAADNDMKGQAKFNQTVNVTIQQMMAKDPNRWLVDLEDQVSRRARNPTRAKRAWKGSVK